LSEKSEFKKFMRDAGGDAVVEAAILFPIMVLIFAALVMVSMYLPVRASLQRSTQRAATAISVEKGDTWLFFDEKGMEYFWAEDRSELNDIYTDLYGEDNADKAEVIVKKTEEDGLILSAGSLTVEFAMINQIIYKEISVTAKRMIKIPIDLSFVGFPKEITVTVTSTAAVANGDEFVRNMTLSAGFAEYISEKYGIGDLKEIGDPVNEVASYMGWK
jgi:hypothetical protein